MSWEPRYYKLTGKLAIPCTMEEWAMWLETADRQVALDRVGGIVVSTVCLGLDHNHSLDPNALPLIFETMIWRGGESTEQFRYGTWDEAEKAHKIIVGQIRAEITEKVNE